MQSALSMHVISYFVLLVLVSNMMVPLTLMFRKPLQLLKSTSEGAVRLEQAHNSPLLYRDDLVLGLKLLLSIHCCGCKVYAGRWGGGEFYILLTFSASA